MKRALLLLVAVFMAGTALAGTGNEAQKKELPRQGSLSFSGGMSDGKIAMPWGSDEEGSSPITGSVSKIGQDTWVMKVFNNSEDTYSVNLKVVQLNSQNRQVKSDSFSYTLKARQKVERNVSAAPGSVRGELKLESWKNLTPKKKEAQPGMEGDAPDQAVQ